MSLFKHLNDIIVAIIFQYKQKYVRKIVLYVLSPQYVPSTNDLELAVLVSPPHLFQSDSDYAQRELRSLDTSQDRRRAMSSFGGKSGVSYSNRRHFLREGRRHSSPQITFGILAKKEFCA